jgi:hypothetical protein
VSPVTFRHGVSDVTLVWGKGKADDRYK